MNRKIPITVNINSGSYLHFLEEIIKLVNTSTSSYVCLANVHMLVEAYRNEQIATAVQCADLVTPDGMPVTWLLGSKTGTKQDRVAGMDLLPDMLELCCIHNFPVFFYGGTQQMLNRATGHFKTMYPKLQIAGLHSPPFRTLLKEEEEDIIQSINDSGAKVVFVVLGCPKQELWMAKMKNRVNSVMIGVGGAMPVLLGLQRRAPRFMQNAGLEWVYRLIQEPKRLWKRYFITNTYFIWLLTQSKIVLSKKNSGEFITAKESSTRLVKPLTKQKEYHHLTEEVI